MTALWLGGPLSSTGALEWTTPQWQVVVAVALAGIAFAVAARGERAWRSRLLELICWALALLGVVIALAGPVWVEEAGRTEVGRVVVLVDGSRSMGVLEDGQPRSERVEAILDHVRGQAERVDLFHFGDDLAIGAPVAFDLPGTDIESALAALSERVAGERLAGVVLVTDGLDRGLLRRRFVAEGVDAAGADLAGPLTVFQVGAGTSLRDLAVRSVDTGGYAFIRSPFVIRADIEGVGFGGQVVPVTLERNGAPVTSRDAVLDAQGRATVAFEVVPEDAGRFAYSVSVPVYEGDAVPAGEILAKEHCC